MAIDTRIPITPGIGLRKGLYPTPPPADSAYYVLDENGQPMLIESSGAKRPLLNRKWQNRVETFMQSRCQYLDGASWFSDFGDEALDWVASGAGAAGAGGIAGVQLLGLFTGATTIRPKYGNAGALVPAARCPWGVAGLGTVCVGGATVAHSIATGITSSNKICFGYKGAISTAFYSIWTEDVAGAVVGIPLTTTIPVKLAGTTGSGNTAPDQTFMLVFDGILIEGWYGASPYSAYQPAGILKDISGVPTTANMNAGCYTRTSGGGTESAAYGAALGITISPR